MRKIDDFKTNEVNANLPLIIIFLKFTFRLLHDAFTENDKLSYKPVIFSHTILSMAAVAEAMSLYDICFEDSLREVKVNWDYYFYLLSFVFERDVEMIKKVITDKDDQNPIEPELADAIKRLWNDKGIKKCYLHKDEIHVSDSAK